MGTLKVNNIQSTTDGSVTFPQGSINSSNTVNGNLSVSGTSTFSNIRISDGIVSTPSLSFTNDTNTGLYRISEDKIGVSIGGVRTGEVGSGYGGFKNNICNIETITGTNDYTGSSGTITDLNYTYTPKFSNSKLVVQVELYWSSNASATIPGLGIQFFYNSVVQRVFYYYTDRSGFMSLVTLSSLTTTLSSASPISMSFGWTPASGSPSVTIYGSTSNHNHYLRIMEIMQ